MVAKKKKWRIFIQLMRVNHPIGTLLLLWPTLWSLWLAGRGWPDPGVLVVFLLGVLMMRSAGCVINDLADRNFDGHVKRTSGRPLPSRQVKSSEALTLFIFLIIASFSLVLTQNLLTIELSFAGLLLTAIYPFMKRYTHLPQLFLGIAFSWVIPMAYAAQSGHVPIEAWLLFLANSTWTIAYDTFYAMVDKDDDLIIGLKSTAILFGDCDRIITGILQSATLLILAWVGNLNHLSAIYFVSLLVAGALFLHQQQLVRLHEREACFKAFLNNNYVGMIIFSGLVLNFAQIH